MNTTTPQQPEEKLQCFVQEANVTKRNEVIYKVTVDGVDYFPIHAPKEQPEEEPQGKTHKVEIASFDTVEIDKLFGPTIFMNLRITASIERGWVIERETQNEEGLLHYVEWTTIPAQLDIDFPKEDT